MISISGGKECRNKVVFAYDDKPINIKGVEQTYYTLDRSLNSINNIYIDNNFYVIIGLGSYKEFNIKKMKSVLAKSIKCMKKNNMIKLHININLFIKRYGEDCLFHVVEGIKLGSYEFYGYKKDRKEFNYNAYLSGISDDNTQHIQELIIEAENIVDGVILARDMVNAPANKLTPELFSEEVLSLGRKAGFVVDILEVDALEKLNMNAFLTVGKSSGNAPKLIVMRYNGDDTSEKVTGLIGKGVTCDTGGYCLKPGETMAGIKGDMAGGAAVVGAIYALAMNKVKANVVGVVPACENRISRESFIPGDVIDSMSGKTIEIINTDAEGRLILADAVTYAIEKEHADKVIDIATLTGVVVKALGFTTAGVLSNNNDFFNDFKNAYKTSGEQYWRFPIYDEYRDLIKSDIADIKNMGTDYLGTITAGLFIESFVKDYPWIHLDIAGTAWVKPPIFEYQSEGATGAGVTTLYYLFGIGEK
ncbi:putative cytosol aminopeptidase [Vallitalea longa]|uniref:Probable cytosol aminopeptidase n=1 Tax=Vallitalea longa TaxID=2936439 RepID=A0A9W6DHC5_9FIRM|nr:leucyl aminopeptidase [Vallitalea longa]GKX30724.1 putative cytosol aminopeptidase [Vallitalea longa]